MAVQGQMRGGKLSDHEQVARKREVEFHEGRLDEPVFFRLYGVKGLPEVSLSELSHMILMEFTDYAQANLVPPGRGESIQAVCTVAGLTREQFDALWQSECRRRVHHEGQALLSQDERLASSVRIERDRWGIPHVFAAK